MNILEQEDLVKGLPDQALFQRADSPSGDIPPFLIISEIQRRTDMRKRFEAAQPQSDATVSDQIVMEGLGSAMAPQNSLPPPAMPAPPSTSVSHLEGSSPLMGQGMAAGGILGFANGGAPTNRRAQVAAQAQARARGQAQTDEYNRQNQRNQLMREYPGAGREELIDLIIPKLDSAKFSNSVSRRQEAMRQADQRIADYESGAISFEQMFGEDFSSVDSPAPVSEEKNVTEIGNEVLDPNTLGGDGNPFGDVRFEDEEEFGFTSSLTNLNPNISIGSGLPVESETEERTTDNIESFIPGTYLNSDLVTEVGETVTQGEALKGAQTTENDRLQAVLDSFESRRSGAEERLGRRRTESQELISQIREEGRRDALSAALVQLGAGIAGGDMSAGLQQAGSAMSSANALARDAARAEQRGMRDYEESVLSQSDQLGMEEAQFAFGAERDSQARAEEIRQWEATHGLAQLNAKNDMIFKQAGLELEADKLENNAYIGRQGLKNQITKMNNDLKISDDTSKREAMRTFTSVLDSVQDFIDDLPPTTTVEEKLEIQKTQQARILNALRTSLGEEFYDAFMRDYKPVRGDDASSSGAISYKNYVPTTN